MGELGMFSVENNSLLYKSKYCNIVTDWFLNDDFNK
jgi:hypothetical protein